jgi:antitoxin MazE
MIATTQKWGNSLAVRIPKTIAQDLSLKAGSLMALSVRDGTLLIRPTVKPAYRLDSLLKGVSKDNLHHEVATGQPIGNEAW